MQLETLRDTSVFGRRSPPCDFQRVVEAVRSTPKNEELFVAQRGRLALTYQIRDWLVYQGQKRRIWALPFDRYLQNEQVGPFEAPGSNCWRGYVATWEVRNDTLHLVELEAWGKQWVKIGLGDLFPRQCGAVEATWFSGEITPDDVINPYDKFLVEMCKVNHWPLHFTWFCRKRSIKTQKLLESLKRRELKAACRAAGLDDGGRWSVGSSQSRDRGIKGCPTDDSHASSRVSKMHRFL